MVEVLSPTYEKFCGFNDTALKGYDIPDCADDVNDRHVVRRELMKSESLRYESYRNWPSSCHQKPSTLAEAGLFYTGIGDRVECPFCFGVLKKWQSKDDPMHEHRHHFPYCRFVLGEDVGNIPILHEQSHKSFTKDSHVHHRITVDQADFTKEETRLTSFSKWPTHLAQTKESLAYAGFYHLPSEEKPDRVKCAYCQGKLYGWDLGDDPWIEHARCFPTCPYIRLCAGEQLINDLLAQHENSSKTRHHDEKAAADHIPTAMKTEAVESVLEMGFPARLVKQVLEKYHTDGTTDPSIEQLLDVLLESEDESERNTRTPERTAQRVEQARQYAVTGEYSNPANAHVLNTSGQVEVASGQSRVEGNATPCPSSSQKCGNTLPTATPQHVRFIYMPCGHPACCGPCAVKVLNCPVCSVKTTGCVKV